MPNQPRPIKWSFPEGRPKDTPPARRLPGASQLARAGRDQMTARARGGGRGSACDGSLRDAEAPGRHPDERSDAGSVAFNPRNRLGPLARSGCAAQAPQCAGGCRDAGHGGRAPLTWRRPGGRSGGVWRRPGLAVGRRLSGRRSIASRARWAGQTAPFRGRRGDGASRSTRVDGVGKTSPPGCATSRPGAGPPPADLEPRCSPSTGRPARDSTTAA